MSVKFTKKSFVKTPGLLVNTPCFESPWFVFKTLIPPISTVISFADKFIKEALSNIISSGSTAYSSFTQFLNASCKGSKTLKESISVWSCVASPLPGVKGTLILKPAF